jgi:hypothetical protein
MRLIQLAILIAVVCAGILLWFGVGKARDAAVTSSCTGHLSQLLQAFREYYWRHHSYPPQKTYLSGGPVASSEVLQRQMKTSQYVFCPADQPGHHWRYWFVSGPSTIMHSITPLKRKDVTDGAENSLLVLEQVSSDPPLPQTGEVQISDIAQLTATTGELSPHTSHGGGRGMIFADLMVCRQRMPMSATVLRALMTANGGEYITRDSLLKSGVLVRASHEYDNLNVQDLH